MGQAEGHVFSVIRGYCIIHWLSGIKGEEAHHVAGSTVSGLLLLNVQRAKRKGTRFRINRCLFTATCRPAQGWQAEGQCPRLEQKWRRRSQALGKDQKGR